MDDFVSGAGLTLESLPDGRVATGGRVCGVVVLSPAVVQDVWVWLGQHLIEAAITKARISMGLQEEDR